MNHPVGYLRIEDQEEYEAQQREQVKLREQESNDAVKALNELNGKVYPTYQEQESNFLNNPNY